MGVLIDAYALVLELDKSDNCVANDKDIIEKLKNPTAREIFKRKPYYLRDDAAQNKQKED